MRGDLVFVNVYEEYYAMDTYSKCVFGIRPDMGLTASAGYQFANNFSITLHGQYGLKDITPTKDGEKLWMKQINTQFGLSIGYSF